MGNYHTNFRITPSTTGQEMIDYAEERMENPIDINGVTVYNFSTHEADKNALNHAVQAKLERELFQIPLQIQTGNMMLQSILPDKIKKAEVLIYRPEDNEYYAYKNLLRTVPVETQEHTKQRFAQLLLKE